MFENCTYERISESAKRLADLGQSAFRDQYGYHIFVWYGPQDVDQTPGHAHTQTPVASDDVPADEPIVIPIRPKIVGFATIGRASNADVRIARPCVSKFQASLTIEGLDAYLTAVPSSTNETFVNGNPLERGLKYLLKNADCVNFAQDPLANLHYHTIDGLIDVLR